MPKRIRCLNLLISKSLIRIEILIGGRKVTFFVPKAIIVTPLIPLLKRGATEGHPYGDEINFRINISCLKSPCKIPPLPSPKRLRAGRQPPFFKGRG